VRGKFRAYSAGSQPKGQVHQETARLLQSLGYDTSAFRSKSWNEFAKPGALSLDFVFTVCDNAAGEVCPLCEKAGLVTLHCFSKAAAKGVHV
jgi:arsenate reductase (thioredoxin)